MSRSSRNTSSRAVKDPISTTSKCIKILKPHTNKNIKEQLYELVKELNSEGKTTNFINDCVGYLLSTKNMKNYSTLGLNKVGKFNNPHEIKNFINSFETEKAVREAQEKAEREKAVREAQEKAEREKAEREAQEKAEREKAEREAQEKQNITGKKMQKVSISKMKRGNSEDLFDPLKSESNNSSGSNSHKRVNDLIQNITQHNNSTRKLRPGGGRKTRKNSNWIQFIKKVYNNEKKINKNFTYKKALKKAASMNH